MPRRAPREPKRRRRRGVEPDEREPRPSRRALAVLPTIAVVLVATVAVVVIRSSTPPVLGAAQGADLRGVLVYAAREGDGWRLWRWHLPTWSLTRGPFLDERPVELLRALDAGEGVVALRQSGAGVQTARILRHLEETDRASTLLTAEQIAWIRGGSTAVSAEVEGVDAEGCGELVLRSFAVEEGRAEERFRRRACARPTALGTSYSTVFVTLSSAQTWGTLGVRAQRVVTSLEGWGLVTASPSGGLLVVPTGALPLEEPEPLSRAVGGIVAGDLGDEPIPYGDDTERFLLDASLGWASDSGGVYVLGTYEDVRGIYLVSIEGGTARSVPVLLAPLAGERVWLTEAAGAALLAVVDGRLYRAREGKLQPIEPPPGAPPPEGPIVWVPSVPDSA